MEKDRELELLTTKKLLELKKKLIQKAQEKSPRDILISRLVDRGVEVLEAAERAYPDVVPLIVKRLADLIKKGVITDYISGGELLQLFRILGLDVRIETKIKIEESGRMISLSEKLRAKEE
ncbi:MAG: double-stranded DNA-binding protein [Nitrososphaerota archaeon]|nr:hypothetical protein [Nitrososphaerales archaeon]MDW8044305.1 double-stranded DNA-binding protein [Nitrososphaerota archaeon]